MRARSTSGRRTWRRSCSRCSRSWGEFFLFLPLCFPFSLSLSLSLSLSRQSRGEKASLRFRLSRDPLLLLFFFLSAPQTAKINNHKQKKTQSGPRRAGALPPSRPLPRRAPRPHRARLRGALQREIGPGVGAGGETEPWGASARGRAVGGAAGGGAARGGGERGGEGEGGRRRGNSSVVGGSERRLRCRRRR